MRPTGPGPNRAINAHCRRCRSFRSGYGAILPSQRQYSIATEVDNHQGKLAQIIRDSIRATGPIPVSRYMQFCLSHPTYGYYKKGEVFGKKGDFITSPEISQIFGELVAIWFLTRYMALKAKGKKIRLIELGPGRGTLMADMLRTLLSFPNVAGEIDEIVLVENSPNMRDMQKTVLGEMTGSKRIKLNWVDHIDEIEKGDTFDMLVAHEFFDAMPINIFEKRENGYREVLVDTDPHHTPNLSTSKTSGLRFAISAEPNPLSTVLPATSSRFAKLPIGSRVEISQDSWKIMRKVGELIGRNEESGAALIIDYGGDRHYGSSFRAFRKHNIVDVFEEPGSADLTANVDFAYLKEATLDSARPLGSIPQSQFLSSLGLQPRLTKLLSSATSDERRADLQHGAKRLIDDLGMGSQYQVMGVVPQSTEEIYPFISTHSTPLSTLSRPNSSYATSPSSPGLVGSGAAGVLGQARRTAQSNHTRAASTSAPKGSMTTTAGLDKARRSVELSRQKYYSEKSKKSLTIGLYSAGCLFLALGVTYAAVPLYRAFCSATGFSGVPITDPARFSPDRLYVNEDSLSRKRITVHFEATASDTLPWEFSPQTKSVRVLPGETALAFYTAKNTGNKDLIGIATYNMTPEKIAPYFAKVECFCFEEQKIRAGEEVDLPVFFFIDRDIMDEPQMNGIDDVVLSYTFFRARRNDKGHLVPDATEAEVEKSLGFEGYELAKKPGMQIHAQ